MSTTSKLNLLIPNSMFGPLNHDIFGEILESLIRFKVLPYKSMQDLFDKRADRKSYYYLYSIYCLLSLSIIRLFLMVVSRSASWHYFLVGYFQGFEGNRREFLLISLNFLFTIYLLRKSSFTRFSTLLNCRKFPECGLTWIDSKPLIYYGFEMLSQFSSIQSRPKKPAYFSRFCKVVNIFWRILLWIRLSTLAIMVFLTIYDPIRGFHNQIDLFFVIRLLFYTILFNFNIFYGLSIAILFLQVLFTVIYFHDLHYIYFGRRFRVSVKRWLRQPSE